MNKKNNVIYYIFISIMYILLFQSIIQNYISIFRYFDEFLAILTIPIIFAHIKKNEKINIKDFIIMVSLFIIFIIGILANLEYNYQPIEISFFDVILVYKFFLVYYLASIINKNKNITQFKDKIIKHIKFIVLLFFLLTIANYIFKIFPSDDIRYGIMVNKLFYGQPTVLVAVCVFLLGLLIMFDEKINTKYTYMLIIVMLSTLRMKAIVFIVAFIIISLYVHKKNKKITFSKIGIIAIICFFVAYEQISFYFITIENSARKVLLDTSIKIANEYFPTGAGFATFASYFSAVHYSPLYGKYGIQNVYGITKENASFISDSFWPMLLGQFGYIGTILYLICILMIFKKIQIQYEIKGKYEYIAKIAMLGYLIISSTSESAFVHPIAILLALAMGL